MKNTGTSTESYTVWVAFKDEAGERMYCTNSAAMYIPAGGLGICTWEAPAVFGTSPTSCEVAFIDDIETRRDSARDRRPGYRAA